MARTLGDIGFGADIWPDNGWVDCELISTLLDRSKRGTPYIELGWRSIDGRYSFNDKAYGSAKALGRLSLIAQRVFDISPDIDLPEDDEGACVALIDLMQMAADSCCHRIRARVEVGEQKDNKTDEMRKRVTYSGYDRLEQPEYLRPEPFMESGEIAGGPNTGDVGNDDDLPF